MVVAQLRQHVSYRWTLFYLDKLIFKHDVVIAIRIKQMDHEFIQKVISIYSSYDKQFVSRDRKRNKCNYKYTFSVEI
ncbi:putative ribosomal export protein Nmd3 [Helianthus debilis subsp. tardiflorus]